jgi:hypothetical protein
MLVITLELLVNASQQNTLQVFFTLMIKLMQAKSLGLSSSISSAQPHYVTSLEDTKKIIMTVGTNFLHLTKFNLMTLILQ